MTMAFYAPGKTFSLAGLVGGYSIIYNPYLRDRVRRASESAVYNMSNVLSMQKKKKKASLPTELCALHEKKG